SGVADYLFITSSYNMGCALLKVEPDGEGACRVKLVYGSDGAKEPFAAHFATPVRVGAFLYGSSDTASSDRDPGMLVCFDVRRDQAAALRRAVAAETPARLVFVVTAADQSGTRRHPLTAAQRVAVVRELGDSLGLPYEVHTVADIPDSERWPQHVQGAVRAGT